MDIKDTFVNMGDCALARRAIGNPDKIQVALPRTSVFVLRGYGFRLSCCFQLGRD